MSGSTFLHQKLNNDILDAQMECAPGVIGKSKAFIREYLINQGKDSLTEVTLNDILAYRAYVLTIFSGEEKKRGIYASLLEQVVFAYYAANNNLWNNLTNFMSSKPVKNKVVGFLLIHGATQGEDINYDLRTEYKAYLTATIAPKKVHEYLKALDQLKLADIQKKTSFKKTVLYKNEKIFLPYWPDFDIAKSFYYFRDKEVLIFDFSAAAPDKMKQQIFQMLNHVLQTVVNIKDRNDRFLLPLLQLYKFCVNNQIADIEQLTALQVQDFRESIDGNVGSKTDEYMQIIANVRKFLFCSAEKINWNAQVWFLDRFCLQVDRVNPAREVKSLDFSDIKINENRELFQMYFKYQIGITPKNSIQTIRGQYYHIKAFLLYLDARDQFLFNISKKNIESYIYYMDTKNIQPETFNKALVDIKSFLEYLHIKKKIQTVPIQFEYFYKKTYERHYYRTVSSADLIRNLKIISHFPRHLRIMCLILIATGLRESEVCALRAGALMWDGKDAWIKVYQSKMKEDKRIPISKSIYDLTMEYIQDEQIDVGEYIFKNKHGGAYNADTFYKQVNRFFFAAGLEDYRFKPHDYRHTIATKFYVSKVPMSVIRDYLGHKNTRMTRQYVDDIQVQIDILNAEYFKNTNTISEEEK